jgi:hypothetical protein
MQPIEIRRNKKALKIMLIMVGIGWMGLSYFIYFSGSINTNTELNIFYSGLTVMLIYLFYIAVKRLKFNEPLLVLTKSGITINEKGNPESFLWSQITEWEIENDDGGEYLTIKTAKTKKKLGISWLEKRSGELKELMTEYSKMS